MSLAVPIAAALSRPSPALVATGILAFALASLAFDWSWTWPQGWVVPIAPEITKAFRWLAREFTIGGIEFSQLLRRSAKVIEWPMRLMQGLLAKGFSFDWGRIAPLPWFSLLGTAMVLAQWAGGWRTALLTGACGLYLLVFGLWASAMLTMATVLIAVAVGGAGGLALGVLAWRSPRAERLLTPFYDTLQVLPIFSYLVPILVFFGFGPLTGLVATVIFAMPPMARITTLALRKLPGSLFDLAAMTGCTRWQALLLVLLPAARADLLVGLNQVVNLSFAVAVFAAIIGSGGLGADLFGALKSLKLGPALEAGLAITLLAIALDRLCRAAAMRPAVHASARGRHLHSGSALALLLSGFVLTLALPPVGTFPTSLTFTTGGFWNEAVTATNSLLGAAIERLRDALILGLLRPVKDALQATPWVVLVAVVAAAALLLEGMRLALLLAALLLFVLVTGYWQPAMTSLYLALLGASFAALVGFPLGVAGALSRRIGIVNGIVVDTIQTLPPFVYLVPVMMLLGIGDVPALAAIALYALAPAIRYTQSGLEQVRRSVLEAAEMSGCTTWQKLRMVQLPIALPDMLLGLNQTVIMAFGMLVITALVGTRGLEADTLKALGKVDTGAGLVAGFGLVAITMVCDRLIAAAAKRLSARRRRARPALQLHGP